MNQANSPKILQYSTLILLGFIWGSSFKLMDMGLVSDQGNKLYSDFELASLRIFFAGAVLYPFSIPLLKKIKGNDWLWLTCVGLFGNFVPAFLFASALIDIEPSISGILNSLTPIFALLLGMLVFGQRYKLIQISGLTLAMIGAIGLITIKGESGEVLLIPCLKVVLAAFCYAVSVNIIKSKLSHHKSVTIASVSLGMMSIPSAILLTQSDVLHTFNHVEGAGQGMLAIVVLSAVGTAFALIIFNYLVAKTTVIFASSVTYIVPIFAVLWGLHDKEHFTWMHAVYGLIVLIGVYLTNRKK